MYKQHGGGLHRGRRHTTPHSGTQRQGHLPNKVLQGRELYMCRLGRARHPLLMARHDVPFPIFMSARPSPYGARFAASGRVRNAQAEASAPVKTDQAVSGGSGTLCPPRCWAGAPTTDALARARATPLGSLGISPQRISWWKTSISDRTVCLRTVSRCLGRYSRGTSRKASPDRTQTSLAV